MPVSVDAVLAQSLLGAPGPTQRRAIAKAITLLESTRADHRERGDALLGALLPHSGKAFRLGISGVPGVGKSTFIEALGLFLIERGLRVAVLAIDPSSSVSGGSILGDKTRMQRLATDERAYVRPSPASGTLGGVAAKTREAMLVCEAAGHDVVIVETVGVGQSETAVAGMTDMFVLLQLPNAGDELQAIKKGVMELADLVVINKADLDEDAATRARAQIASALRLLGQQGRPEHAQHGAPRWHAQVMQASALRGIGLDAFWEHVSRFREAQRSNGHDIGRRHRQDEQWMWERIEAGLHQSFRTHNAVHEALPETTRRVLAGQLVASVAARQLLGLFEATPKVPCSGAGPALRAAPSPGLAPLVDSAPEAACAPASEPAPGRVPAGAPAHGPGPAPEFPPEARLETAPTPTPTPTPTPAPASGLAPASATVPHHETALHPAPPAERAAATAPPVRRSRRTVSGPRVSRVEEGGVPAILKRRRPVRGAWRYALMYATAQIFDAPSLRPVQANGGVRAQTVELRRLRELASAGVAVPAVLRVADDGIVMQFLGDRTLVEAFKLDAATGLAAWRRGLDAIADVHARGQVLSQAFARNMLEHEGRIWFIDFEEDPLETLSLAQAQARDWLAYLLSSLWLLAAPRAALLSAWETTVQTMPAPVVHGLQGDMRHLLWLRHLPQQRRPWGSDIISVQALAAFMQAWLAQKESTEGS